jgi:hypothetical protein
VVAAGWLKRGRSLVGRSHEEAVVRSRPTARCRKGRLATVAQETERAPACRPLPRGARVGATG